MDSDILTDDILFSGHYNNFMNWFRLGAVILSAIAVSLAQPNDFLVFGSWLIALIAWAPFFWALRNSDSYKEASLWGLIFGFLSTLFQCYWLAFFKDYAVWTLLGPTLIQAGFIALLAPILRFFLTQNSAYKIFFTGALWAIFEFFKSNGFLGFPWGLAPYPFFQLTPIINIVDLAGLGILTFLIISLNCWLSEIAERNFSFLPGLFLLSCIVIFSLYGLLEPKPAQEEFSTVKLVLVQQNADPWDSRDDVEPLKKSVRLSQEGLADGGVDMVVWSETSIRFPLQFYRPFFERLPQPNPLLKTIRTSGVYWLLGNPYAQDEKNESGWVNAAVLMNPKGKIEDYYGKIQQIPFAEYVPYWDVPWVKDFFQTILGVSGSWEIGKKITVFEIAINGGRDSMKFSTPICFEDTYSWLSREMVKGGAQVLVNLTNESWSQRDFSQNQHLLAAYFRTLETHIPLVRSTNSGATLVIDGQGKIIAGPLPYFQADKLIVNLPIQKKPILTPYVLWGDWIIYLFIAICFTYIVFIYFKKGALCYEFSCCSCGAGNTSEYR